MIGIIDYKIGNLGSIYNMLDFLGFDAVISSDKDILAKCDKLILPGVGSFDTGMKNLQSLGLINFIKDAVVQKKTPLLGICLGMQLLGIKSEEGVQDGLSLLPFTNIRFRNDSDTKLIIPHMGWDFIEVTELGIVSPLLKGITSEDRFYFVHSYHAEWSQENIEILTCEYGSKFPAAVSRSNIFGVQFHPEKSHKFGMKILKNFAEMNNV